MIRKAIAMLSALIEGRIKHSSLFESESSSATSSATSESIGSAFSSMFGSGSAATEPKKKAEEEDIPRIIEY